jgi:hypothetical protein
MNGGGIGIAGGNVLITDAEIYKNYVLVAYGDDRGGGVGVWRESVFYYDDNGNWNALPAPTVNIVRTDIYKNTAGYGAGGYFAHGYVNISDSTVRENTATEYGGGLQVERAYNGGPYVSITATSFYSNTAPEGAALAVLPGNSYYSNPWNVTLGCTSTVEGSIYGEDKITQDTSGACPWMASPSNKGHCRKWCDFPIASWTYRCSLKGCQGCDVCGDDTCKPWCQDYRFYKRSWNDRCKLEGCDGCPVCGPSTCKDWCSDYPGKCSFEACDGCDECR